MYYPVYLSFLQQMMDQKRARLVLEDELVWVEKNAKGFGWKISMEISSSSKKNWFLRDVFPWQKGSYIERNEETGSLFLVQEIPQVKTFIFFKKIIEEFLSSASEWKDIFR